MQGVGWEERGAATPVLGSQRREVAAKPRGGLMDEPQPTEARREDASTRRTRALLQLGALATPEFGRALREILRIDAGALDVARVSFWWLQRDPPRLVCEEGYVASAPSYEAGTSLEGAAVPAYLRAVQEQRALVVEDVSRDPRTRELGGYLDRFGVGALLDVPVWSRGAVVGVLCHEHVGGSRAWKPDEVEFATAVGQAVATALEARDRDAAESAARRAHFLARATAALSEVLDVEQIPARLAGLAVPEIADWCTIHVLEEGELRCLAATHVDPALSASLLDRAQRPRVTARPPRAVVLETGEPLLLPRIAHDQLRAVVGEEEARLLAELGTSSILAVPLTAHGQRIGALTLGIGRARRPYGEQDLDLARELGDRAAIAIENARLFRQAQDAVAARDEFLSIASHELYTPITSLKLAVQTLARDRHALSPEAVARANELLQRQVDRLAQLVGELLSITRIRAGRLPLELDEVDLCEVVRSVIQQLEPDLVRAGCPLTLDCPERLAGRWDRSRLGQVVTNLLTNALKFGTGRPIEVELRGRAEEVLLRVRDHGIGIEPQQLARLFQPYERAAPAGTVGGLGLGLYIVRGIVEALGGTVTVESAPGEGSTFQVALPRCAPAARAAA